LLSGAVAAAMIAVVAAWANGPAFIGGLDRQAEARLAAAGATGVTARFATRRGWLTRHPVLIGGARLDSRVRQRAALAVAAVPGVGGVRWRDPLVAQGVPEAADVAPGLHCQNHVQGILKSRTIRFTEGSAAIDPASYPLVDEVVRALRPCDGSLFAITGHTDESGEAEANLSLSLDRARTVREMLAQRGIPRDALRPIGAGSQEPLEGLDRTDPANRRIEFSVIEIAPLRPTPVDTPGAG
jgi:OmpA-OmpF porin, OOP family